MSWLFAEKKKNASPDFGISMGDSKFKAAVKLNDIEEKFKKTNEKITSEATKFKNVANLNKKLTESYVQNYYVMLDISKLLKDYADVFEKLSEMLKKYDNIEISPMDMDHLKLITRAKLDELNGDFTKQSTSIRSLYSKYNMGNELNKLSAVEPLARNVGSSVDETLSKFIKTGGTTNYLKKTDKGSKNGRTSKEKKGKKTQKRSPSART